MNKELTLGIIVSLVIHMVIIVSFPDFSRALVRKMNYIEIDFIPRERLFTKGDETGREAKPHLKPFIQRAEKLSSQRIKKSFADIGLPAVLSGEKSEIMIEKKPELPLRVIERLSHKKDDVKDRGVPSIDDFLEREKKRTPSDMFSRRDLLKKKILMEEMSKRYGEEEFPEPVEEIKGPVAKRRVIYRPPLPQKIRAEGEIELKFWVLPDGTVGRIIPLKKSDPLLEEEAIRYLKEWKFNSLPYESRQEEWGIIPLRFVLK